MTKQVTEQDFRMPEFIDAKPDDYEFRANDGRLVRKDRWEQGMISIASALGFDLRKGFEIPDVVERARALSKLHSVTGLEKD